MRFISFLVIMVCAVALKAQDNTTTLARDSNIIRELFFKGIKEKMVDNYAAAQSSFTKITQLDQNNDAAYFELANIGIRQQKYLEAEIAIKKALTINSRNPWYFRLQAELYKRNGNMAALVGVFDKLIAMSPEEENLYFDRANALFLSGKADEALLAYREIEAKFGNSPSLTAAVQRIKMQSSAAPNASDIDKLLAEQPGDIKNYLYLSGVMLEKGKKEESLAILQKAKLLAPEQFEVDLAMADAYQALKKPEEAMKHLQIAFSNSAMPVDLKVKIVREMLPKFNQPTVVRDATQLLEQAVKITPEDAKLLVLQGDVFYQQGNYQAAKSNYQAVLKLSDQLYAAWEKLLAIQTLMGDYAEAIKTGEEALSIYPNQAVLYYYRAFALHRNGQNAEAGVEIKSALALDADDAKLKAMIFALQAEVLIDQQKLKEADVAFDKSIALDPNNFLTLGNYAYYLALRNHDLTKAEALAAKAAMALPNNSSIADTYSFVLFKLEKYEQAKLWIERALKNNEANNPVYLEHYGDILFQKGERDLALEQWKKAKMQGNSSEKLVRKINEKKYIK